MEACSDGDASSSSIQSHSAEKLLMRGTSASAASSTNCPVAVMGAAGGRQSEAASTIVLIRDDVDVVVCVCVCVFVVVVVVNVADKVLVVVHDAATASTLSFVVVFVKAAAGRHSSRSAANP